MVSPNYNTTCMHEITDERTRDAWTQYKLDGNTDARNTLIEAYLPVVKYHADRMSAKIHRQYDAEELMTAGVFGLMDAIDAFDFDRGFKFETFAAHRVRGAILDELRSMDWVPRLVRARTSKVERVRESLTVANGERPSEDVLAGELGMSRREYDKISHDVGVVGFVSLQNQIGEQQHGMDREVAAEDILADERQDNPVDLLMRSETRDVLLDCLSRIERLIIILYYFEGMTMKEISSSFDISESRVCQLHSLILVKLRNEMRRQESHTDRYALAG